MAGVQAAKCCCDCWYRIPLCGCEDDKEVNPLFLDCPQVQQFFLDHPELEGHLVFEYFDGEHFLCYDMRPKANLKVTILPPNAVVLPEPPPPETWFYPDNDCVFCCPNACCGPCGTGPGGSPVCCYRLGDTGTLTVDIQGTTTNEMCCNTGLVTTTVCPAMHYQAQYAVTSCSDAEVVFSRLPNQGPGECLPGELVYNCYPGFGGWDIPEHDCLIPDPCFDPPGGACEHGPLNGCELCAVLNPCCLRAPIVPPFPDPNCEAPSPDVENTCFSFFKAVGFLYLKEVRVGCGNDAHLHCHPGGEECDCQVLQVKFNANPTCTYVEDKGICVP